TVTRTRSPSTRAGRGHSCFKTTRISTHAHRPASWPGLRATATARTPGRIINAAVFDGVSDGLADGPVHVADGRIVSVGGPPQPADRVIDARGGTVLPGLIDAHRHAYGIRLDMMATEAQPVRYVALAAARRLGRALGRGFTTVRDPAGGDAGLARAIAENLIPSPRYLWTGAALSQTGGHGDARGPDSETCPCYAHGCEVVDGVD